MASVPAAGAPGDALAPCSPAGTLTFLVGNDEVPRKVSAQLRTVAKFDLGKTAAHALVATRVVESWLDLQIRYGKPRMLRWGFESWLHALSQRVCAKCSRVRKECQLRRCRLCSRLFCWPRTNLHFLTREFS